LNIADALRSEAPSTNEVIERYVDCLRDMHAILGKLTEIGEVADQYKRHIFYGKSLDPVNTKEEVGDGQWYDSLLLDATNKRFNLKLTHEECFEAMVAKLKARYPEKFTEQLATNRNLEAERKVLEDRESCD
jgi:hypothetical protein